MGITAKQREGGRVWAKIAGQSNYVELPARRGRRGVLLAKTCIRCGSLRMAADYGITGRNRSPDPCCNPCKADAQRGSGNWRNHYAASRRRDKERQATTEPSARRRGYQWTGPELETALRYELSSVEVAQMLGRTKYAVETIRRRHKREPMLQRIAGVS